MAYPGDQAASGAGLPPVGAAEAATGGGGPAAPPETTSGPPAVQPPAIALPKGGGAIRSIGEKFVTNPVTGTATASIPIATSPGRSGFGPQPMLSYDSGNGNGPFGFGWTLPLASVTRKTDKGLPQYRDAEESDVFILTDAEDLVPVLDGDGVRVRDTTSTPGYRIDRYRPRVEGAFARIERWTREHDGDVHWRTISRDNVLTVYGKNSNSRIVDPEDPARIFSWLICETRDDKGNAIAYEYKPEDGAGAPLDRTHQRSRGGRDDPRRGANRYLKRVRYGNRTPRLDPAGEWLLMLSDAELRDAGWMFELVFDYGEHDADVPTPRDAGEWTHRGDAFSSYRSGFEVRTARLCRRVLMFHHFAQEPEIGTDCLVSSTDFTYGEVDELAGARSPVYTFLRAVTRCGYRRRGRGYLKRSLPPVEYEYTQAVVQDAVHTVNPADLANLPVGVDGAAYRWTDLHGEGIPGILTEQAGGWLYKRNLSPISHRLVELAPAERVSVKPNETLTRGRAQFMDLAGDGRPDLVVLDGRTPGLYEHDDREGWRPFRPFSSRLNRDTRDPNLRLIDLTGDGRADVLVTEDDAYVWHPSLGEDGFGDAHRVHRALDEERGPRLVFADGTDCVYLADVSGDGLSDLVRIRNGEVCYWPNLGYGRFGAKVTIDSAPRFDHPDRFDPKRIRLADIDGTGTTDIVYLHPDGVRLYFNQSGNGWSVARRLSFPRLDDVVDVTATDLLGNGTACLVWSSPLPGDVGRQLRYVDLMGGQKPHLLVRTVSNLGAETRVEFASSTRFYLQDRRDGYPWITRLPFPVHVVTRVETLDHVSGNRFVTRFAYHHGHFDGEEREFRGFGMVEQWDTEEFDVLAADRGQPKATNIDPISHVPPVLTRTWFHTGIHADRMYVSDYFAGLLHPDQQGEYYREPGLSAAEVRRRLLPDTMLPADLTPEEEREACRALSGVMLRQETYALDGTDKAGTPYLVDERNYTVRRLQRHGGNRHAVFFTHSRETLSYHYERNSADPRISHALTLDVDAYGNVLKELSIGYGRRTPSADPVLTAADRAKQTRSLIVWTENSYTNPVSTPAQYRAPVPAEVRRCELTGFTPENGAARFSFDEWSRDGFALAASAAEIPFEQSPNHVSRERRLLDHIRTRYRSDDLAALLPVGVVEPLALPGESYKLALTESLLTHVFTRHRPDYPGEPLLPDPAPLLEGTRGDQGGYTVIEGSWWISSGRAFFDPAADPADSAVTASSELETARRHFYLNRKVTDPFGHGTTVDYDQHDLLVTRTSDALGNTVTAANDYRVLQPWLVTHANRNRSAAAFDALGMVVATATMGKDNERVGDLLSDFDPDPPLGELQRFTADPPGLAASLLGKATTRVVYDVDRYRRTGQPAIAAALTRETHVHDPGGAASKVQIGFTYADGFGREVQKKTQAEPGDGPQRQDAVTLPTGDLSPGELVRDPGGEPVLARVANRWVGSGRTVFNNKGKPVRQYEPFFSATHLYEPEREMTDAGVSLVLFYDPVGRVVVTLHPDHSYEKVVFDPWQQTGFDLDDTVAPRGAQTGDPRTDPDVAGYVRGYFRRQPSGWRTWYAQHIDGELGIAQREVAEEAAAHADTPTTTHLDTLGRPVVAVGRNRYRRDGEVVEEAMVSRVDLDVEGNPRAVSDALDRVVMRYDYDLLGTRLHQASMESGERWTLNDVTGKPIRTWNSRDVLCRVCYDELRRRTHLYVTESGAERLAERTVYGEGVGNAGNHRTRIYRVFDGAGVVTNGAYDFKGNVLDSTRDLLPDYRHTVNWLDDLAADDGTFTTRTTYDALNRPVTITSPDGSVHRPGFNTANLVERIDVNLRGAAAGTPFVTNIDYDAKGQRTRVDYGNGAVTTFDYDPLTFRLTRLRTTRPADPDAAAPSLFREPSVVQDLHHVYDPVGNLSRVEDAAFDTVFHGGSRIEPVCHYTYDALYRIIEARGREHIGQSTLDPELVHPSYRDYPYAGSRVHSNDLRALRSYVQRFAYDVVGNLLQVRHLAGVGSWTRQYAYEADSLIEPGRKSNRLTGTTLGNGVNRSEAYSYDAHGNMTAMPHLQAMGWDFKDQLEQVQLPGGRTAYYVYDVGGTRIRKVIIDPDGQRHSERIYIGGYELYREFAGPQAAPRLARESLHVMDDKQRVAIVETQTIRDGEPVDDRALHRYQLANHLGSSTIELDQDTRLISYEEYHPYGTTALQVGRTAEVNLKRYRYTGKERDEETGFTYHGARFYAPWLGRWTSCDRPATRDYLNSDGPPYTYVQDRPTGAVDPDGGFIWFLAAAVVVAVIATPQIANAPGPGDKTYTRSTGELALNMAENAVMIYAAPRLLAGGAALIAEQGLVRGGAAILTRVGAGIGLATAVQKTANQVDPSGTLGRVLNLATALYLLRPRIPSAPSASTEPPPVPPAPGATSVGAPASAEAPPGAAGAAPPPPPAAGPAARPAAAPPPEAPPAAAPAETPSPPTAPAPTPRAPASPSPAVLGPTAPGPAAPAPATPGPAATQAPPAPAPAALTPGGPAPAAPETLRFRIGEGVRRAVASRELGKGDVEAIDTETRQPLGRIPLDQLLSTKPSIVRDPRFLSVLRGLGGGNPPGAPPVPPVEVTPLPPSAPGTNLTPVPQVRLLRWRGP